MNKVYSFIGLALSIISASSLAAQFAIGGDPRVKPEDFQITTFADDLNYPVGMVELDDGSILVAVSNGDAFFGSTTGQFVRLVDTDDDGIAEERSVILDGVPGGGLSGLRRAGDMLVVTGQGRGKPITIYRLGAGPSDAPTELGRLFVNYNQDWLHPHSALEIRRALGQENTYEIFFHLGSKINFAPTTETLTMTSTIGIEGPLAGDAIHRVTFVDDGESISGTELLQVATGLRSAAGYAFHPVTGDLYFEDNGIDGLQQAIEAHSADEINFIAFDQIGGEVEDFGFSENYIAYRTGEFVGGQGIPPLVAFTPIPEPQNGAESEGPNDIAFAPPGFPPGLNNGLFVGFHGQFSRGGRDNEENPLVYADLETGEYFHFIGVDEPGVGHLDGLLATGNKLFAADISSGGGFNASAGNSGVIYQIRYIGPESPTAVEQVAAETPDGFELEDAYPNPFNPETTIRFSVPQLGGAQQATLKIFDLSGQEIVRLVDETVGAGVYRAQWDGRDAQGRVVASGTYIYQLEIGSFRNAKRMVLLK